MKKDYTHIVVVLDRSGSMYAIENDTVQGFNKFLETQKAVPGEATFSLTQFDTVYETMYNFVAIQKVKPLDKYTFVPRGMTALYDAIGKTISETGVRLASLDESERPEKVVFVIITDGQENASLEYAHSQINNMIQHQKEKYSWEFVFLGANQDAMAVGDAIGVGAANAITYGTNTVAVRHVYDVMSNKLATYRTGVVTNMSYTEEDREEQDSVN